ncbi:MAG TPA: hypothetical protein VD962_01680 [Rubricoccaceae bacterium]|nr:hypothetical protein [Rubricoccaceae bacterium]
MPAPSGSPDAVVDMHVHVGLCGDRYPTWGRFSDWYRSQPAYHVFLHYARLEPGEVSDAALIGATRRVIEGAEHVRHVVCLALDPIYELDAVTGEGRRREDRSHVWVDNAYVVHLRELIGERVLLGASVHPYAPDFKERVAEAVEQGAVLLKWLPSAQHIDLAHERVAEALTFLATARDGKPLPLLLHVGVEYAIPPAERRRKAADFLSWGPFDRVLGWTQGWRKPDLPRIHANLRAGLDAGGVLILAHCGLPYFGRALGLTAVEHDDFAAVRRYLRDYPADGSRKGRCFADVSACATPFRARYFDRLRALPAESLLFGSDYPTPIFELSAGAKEVWEDFKAVGRGDLSRAFLPEDNLLDVNLRELRRAFPGHPMFTRFARLLDAL